MMAHTHMLFGLLAGLLFFPGYEWYVFIPLCVLGALLPDVDHENSKINHMLPVTRWVPSFFQHRGFFHSIYPPLILLFAFHYFGLGNIGLPLAIGYVSHLLSDCLTVSGCNLLHPFATMRVQGFINTGSVGEFIVMGVVGSINALVLWRLLF